jgi:AmmeMemoRadiSam system protein A
MEKSPYAKLARLTIEEYIKNGHIIDVPPDTPEELLNNKAGVFVTLHKHGRLRGCIGTFIPTQENIAKEIIRNAISAATEDPRFPTVSPSELEELEISVDVLSEPEEIEDISELDPKKYGIIVESGFKRGLLLPDIEGVDTVEEQIEITKRKAGIYPGEPIKIYRFTVKRYH